MFVQQERRTVQSNRGLSGSRATLHDDQIIEASTDDDILLRLDGGNNVTHFTGTTSFQFSEQGIWNAATFVNPIGIRKVFIEQPRNNPVVNCQSPSEGKPLRVSPRRSVERNRNRHTPVENHRFTIWPFDVASSDMPFISRTTCDRFFVNAPETKRRSRFSEVLEAHHQGIFNRRRIVSALAQFRIVPSLLEGQACSGTHCFKRRVRKVQVGLFSCFFSRLPFGAFIWFGLHGLCPFSKETRNSSCVSYRAGPKNWGHAAHSTDANRPGQKTYRINATRAIQSESPTLFGVNIGYVVIDANSENRRCLIHDQATSGVCDQEKRSP
jgi:hypothetical protein